MLLLSLHLEFGEQKVDLLVTVLDLFELAEELQILANCELVKQHVLLGTHADHINRIF